MSQVANLLALIRAERDSLLPFFDPFAQLGNAYDDLRQMERGVEFQRLVEFQRRGETPRDPSDDRASEGPARMNPDPKDLAMVEKLAELTGARAWLLHMALAFSAERQAGKWPELLKHEANAATARINAAISSLEE